MAKASIPAKTRQPAQASLDADTIARLSGHREQIEDLTHKRAMAEKGAAKLRAAAEHFMAVTDALNQTAFGQTESGKSLLQVLRNEFAEALNDMPKDAAQPEASQ